MIVEVLALRTTSWNDRAWDYAIYYMLRSPYVTGPHESGRVSPKVTGDWPGRHMRPWADGKL